MHNYPTGVVTIALLNVGRLEWVTLEFHSNIIEEIVLEYLVGPTVGRDSALVHRMPLAGLHGQPAAGR